MVLSDNDHRPATRAGDIAITMQTIMKHILAPRTKSKYDEKISCGIGIDYGKMLVIKVGMRRDPDHKDLVWARGPANMASKFADAAIPGEIRISEAVYSRMKKDLKKMESDQLIY